MADDVSVQGLEELFTTLEQLDGASKEALIDGCFAGALVLEGAVKITIEQSSHSGRRYRRGASSHQASAPGESPAIDYGYLINSVASGRESNGATVYSNAEAAPHLEFGTARMAARPFMRKAVNEHNAEILTAIEVTTRARIEGSVK